jgi:hypothetical protein
MPDTPPPVPDVPASGQRSRGRLWLRPVLLAVVGVLVAVGLVLVDQILAGILLGLFALFMGYWTSPLRSGAHTPLAQALERRGDDVAIVLWAPGDPLSSRLQGAIRGQRDDVIWVNTDQDPAAAEFLEVHGGRGALPLVLVGSEVVCRATGGDFLDAKEAGEERARAA